LIFEQVAYSDLDGQIFGNNYEENNTEDNMVNDIGDKGESDL
jgi:hypothetical protein